MKEKNFDTLFQAMRIRTPILLLGAGFSLGAKNERGDNIPLGRELSEKLYNHFFCSGMLMREIDHDLLSNIEKDKSNLKAICNYLRILNHENERNKYLTDQFTGCQIVDTSAQHLLVDYPWSYIFSLNIDDLVERIYYSAGIPLSVWDFSHPFNNDDPHITRLVKLHGSVSDSDSGYIFDDEEYRQYSIDSCSLLKEFAHQALEHDLIMVGTEFQEDDLLTILSIYKKCGYNGSKSKRYYITPTISNVSLRLQIEQSKDDIWIEATGEQFLKALKKKVTKPYNNKNALSERGVVFLDEINKQTPSSLGIYKGKTSVYADFFHDADILHPDLDSWLNEIEKSDTRTVTSFFGDSYVGKTCCAKRVIVELYKKGYEAIQISFLSTEVMSLLKDYLIELPDDSKVVLYIEGASYSYNDIVLLKNQSYNNIGKLVIVTEDTTENHKSKRYILLPEESFLEYRIRPYMDEIWANSIYCKLAQKRRLGHYLNLLLPKSNPFDTKSKKIIIKRILHEQDIIDALYYSSEGKSFQDHYSFWLNNKVSNNEIRVIQMLCCLSRLGIHRVPITLFVKMGEFFHRGFAARDFYPKFNEIITLDSSFVVLRRSQILTQLLSLPDSNLLFDTLFEVASYCVPANDYEKTESAFIFQKVLRVKRVRDSKLLTNEELLELLKKLEPLCKHISYFWVQYGIAAQITGNFEDANNHLSYAKNMRPNSYQVRHALAKNHVEWGLYMITQGNEENGIGKFLGGINELRMLVNNSKYSRSFRYSVHTMVSALLKYSAVTKKDLDEDICLEISSLLEKILCIPLDTMLDRLIKQFIYYCKQRNQYQYCSKLLRVNKMTGIRMANEETYDID